MMIGVLEERLAAVEERIARAAGRAGRSPADVTLIAVTKSWPAATLEAAFRAGLRHFGENRAAELAEKRPAFEAACGRETGVTWHFIGHLQSRQSQAVADLADQFHAADRLKIIERLGRQVAANGRALPLLLEVNISGEASKEGFEATDWENRPEQRTALLAALTAVHGQERLSCLGLMTMAPWEAEPDVIRSVFRRTRRLRDALEQASGQPLPMLSMGMTDDFEIAVEEGATHIRVGRALFGERLP